MLENSHILMSLSLQLTIIGVAANLLFAFSIVVFFLLLSLSEQDLQIPNKCTEISILMSTSLHWVCLYIACIQVYSLYLSIFCCSFALA